MAAAGCEGFWTGGSEPITLSEKEYARLDANRCILFNRRMAKKSIPVQIAHGTTTVALYLQAVRRILPPGREVKA